MIKKLKNKLILLVEIVHRRIFGHEMSEKMREFLKNLSWSFFGGVMAAGIMFVVNIFAGRFLGPVEYGKYNLILLMSQFFIIPMIFGMDVSVLRKIAKAEDENETRRLLSGAVFFVGTLTLIVAATVFLNVEFVSNIFSAKSSFVFIAIIFSIVLTLKTLFDGIIKGLYFFKLQSVIRSIEALITALIFFVLYIVLKNYLSLIYSAIVAGLFVSIVYAFKLKHFFEKPDIDSIKKLLKYSRFVIASSLVAIIMGYGDRFVVNKYFGTEELGIYSAYYAATILVAGQFISIITNVFFAMVAKIEEKNILLKKIDRMLVIGMIPITAAIFIGGFIILKLFGNAYKSDILILILFSVIAALQFFVSFYANIVNVHSEKTYFWGLLLFFVRTLFYVIYILILIKLNVVSVLAILIGMIINYIVDIFNLRYIIKKYA